MWEWVTEEGGRKERNKSDQQTKSQLIQEESPLLGGITLLGNSAQRDRSLWSHQSRSEAKAWFSLSTNGSLPAPRMEGGIEISKLCQKIIFFRASWKHSLPPYKEFLREIAQRPLKKPSLGQHVFHTQSGTWIFLAISWHHLKTQPARIVRVGADPGWGSSARSFLSQDPLRKMNW